MRKKTKVVVVASAAALLAIGASMTSFAAIGWIEEDGQWYYYDRDGVLMYTNEKELKGTGLENSKWKDLEALKVNKK